MIQPATHNLQLSTDDLYVISRALSHLRLEDGKTAELFKQGGYPQGNEHYRKSGASIGELKDRIDDRIYSRSPRNPPKDQGPGASISPSGPAAEGLVSSGPARTASMALVHAGTLPASSAALQETGARLATQTHPSRPVTLTHSPTARHDASR